MLLIAFLSLLVLAAWVYLTFAHGHFWLPLLPYGAAPETTTPSVDIIVPARDEANVLTHTIPALLAQDYTGSWRVLLIDDHSTDGTASVARQCAEDAGKSDKLVVLSAPDLAKGWSGKVAAMNVGLQHTSADFVLFTDADIVHPAHSLRTLVARAQALDLDLVSRMVKLHCASVAEKLMIPAFVFFFAMLYPFRRANDPATKVAAAAGGVMLARRTVLDRLGGLSCIKAALIDDCSLAKAFKNTGASIELMLSRDIESLRPYTSLAPIWSMITRTAYTQLRYAPLWLIGTVIGLALLFLLPVGVVFLAPNAMIFIASLTTLTLMTSLYAPMVKFYDLPIVWTLALPLAALLYAAATVDSARRYYQGKGGQWKGRSQA